MKRYSKLRSQLAVASVGMSILLVAQASEAASIGQTYIHSQQNEPLLASIDINDIDSKEFSVAIASDSTYQNMGLDSPTPIDVEFVKKSANSGALVLTSQKPILEPFADVVLIVNNKGQTKSVPTTLLLPLDKQDHLLSNLNEHARPILDSDEQRTAKQEAFALAQQVLVRSPLPHNSNGFERQDNFESKDAIKHHDNFEPLVLSKHLVPPLLETNPHDSSLILNVPINTAIHKKPDLNKNLTPHSQNHLESHLNQETSGYQPLTVNTQSPPILEDQNNSAFDSTANAPITVVRNEKLNQHFETLNIVSNSAPQLFNESLESHNGDTQNGKIQADSDAIVLKVNRTITNLPTNSSAAQTSANQTNDTHINDKSANDIVSVVNVKVMQYLEEMNQPHDDQVVISSNGGTHHLKTV